ncbi:GGDEF domain-containing protein [Aureimonas jatrophae]|uniref:diguanylate cyclase n=1 Tax=Aureimonas jatrophae TaxID=1166073 RepID=A0A1H0HN45_9HYPH|nr:diguanylate cyclase [Aureimonas jatrophae]MBB3950682.1 diguanylate cyclase (GGDEF)-like protein [Aureimonas jatrophae]SDO20626.1 diguanylate cyclase (GGDEF) domain-containing protein [Aureimonas jatrophae]
MSAHATNPAGMPTMPGIGLFLRLPSGPREAFARDTEQQRVRQLRATVVLGLVFYNLYNLSNFILMQELGWVPTILRLLVTAAGGALVWCIPHLGLRLREALVAIAMTVASLVPVLLFWLTRSSLGPYSYSDFLLTVVFACVIMVLRFPAAIFYNLVCMPLAFAAIWTQPALQTELRLALTLQTGTAMTFLLVGNWLIQRMQRQSYVEVWMRTREATELEAARRSFAALSTTDALTGISNRRRFDEVLAEAHARARAAGVPYALLMIDVDHFKGFNDAYGHPAGDACLRSVADVLACEAADCDALVARYGGEEFAVVLRGATREDGERLARRLLMGVEARRLPHGQRPDAAAIVTVSIGVAAFEEAFALPTAVLHAADAALYEAKRHGRNRHRVFGGDEPEALVA